jgi:eukaryotic-like serine/threonine-protein kinase
VGAGARLDPQRAGAGALSADSTSGTRKLTRPEWQSLQQAFEALADLPPDRRAAALSRLELDPFLAARLHAMLAAQEGEGMLDGAVSGTLDPAPPAAYASLAPGALVGAFRIERLIGRGGMGEVYLARREADDFDQRVALKMLRPEAAGRFALFAAERRTLAGLEHPGIARLVDGGVAPDGRPYMAMDYVEGEEIDLWCRTHAADVATRLGLFLALCEAVSHAHARLVIHRDIKPANILVDAQGRPRLLDFGVARLLDTGDETRPLTAALLTPQYAAPEQFDGAAMTVATDVYALGAMLYELLAGHGPWDADGAASLPTVVRRLLHDEPAPPSQAARLPDVPAAAIAGDLDAIVLKAMRRAPEARYSSVEALAADVRRHLAFEPVAARAGATGYRVRRFVRRNRWGVGAVAAIVLALLVGGAGIAWQAHRAGQERDAARAQAERSEAVNQALMLMFREAGDRGHAGSITARDLIDSTAARLAASLNPDDTRSAATIAALSDLYVLTENLPGSQSLLERALARGIGRSDPAGLSRLRLKLAQDYGATRRFAEARRLLVQAQAVWADDPDSFRTERVEAASTEAYMLRLEGKADEGIALLERTMPEAERAYADNSRDLATRYANLATHLVMANRLGEAQNVIRRSEALLARTDAMRSPAGLTLMQLRGSIAAREGATAEAERIYRQVAATRRALYGRSYSLAADLLQDGRLLTQLGRPDEALNVLDEAQSIAADSFGRTGSLTLLAGLGRAEALLALGRRDEATQALASAAPGLRALGASSAEHGALLLVEARFALAQGDHGAAAAKIDQADRLFRALGPAGAAYQRDIERLRR